MTNDIVKYKNRYKPRSLENLTNYAFWKPELTYTGSNTWRIKFLPNHIDDKIELPFVEARSKFRNQNNKTRHHISNIYLMDESKVKLWQYPTTIFRKIMEVQDNTDKDVFNLWDGCIMRVKLYIQDDILNYSKCSWDTPEDSYTDKEKEAIFKELRKLSTFGDLKARESRDPFYFKPEEKPKIHFE